MKISSSEIRPTERGRATRSALLEAGARLLAEGGFDALTTTSVAESAGVSTGTFYAHFADKHALLEVLFARSLDRIVERVESVLTADRLLDDGLEATLGAAVDLVLQGYRADSAILRTALARTAARPELRDLYWSRHARSIEIVERFIRRGARAGLIRQADPAVLAQAVLVVTQGLNTPVLLGSPRGRLVAGIQRELVRALVGLLTPQA